jgi:hypothetical protein
MGVHQRIDRIARRKLAKCMDDTAFPSITNILHFEGKNGPDGIKSKSPARDEPWHFVDPSDKNDSKLYEDIEHHIHNLSIALRNNESERASFEAAWLAHAVVDGLTPAHQYSLSDKIEELWGKPKEERMSVMDKNVIRGSNTRDTFSKNWKYWGAGGVWTTHYMFELGFAVAVAPQRYTDMSIQPKLVENVDNNGYLHAYKTMIHEVYEDAMYEEYYKKGWTRHLASESRDFLMPLLVDAVALAWYEALKKAKIS